MTTHQPQLLHRTIPDPLSSFILPDKPPHLPPPPTNNNIATTRTLP